jgi:organic hydroperoxide reductase OsmC/OhrA
LCKPGKKVNKLHNYQVTIHWTGNTGTGTAAYTTYQRDHEIRIEGKPMIAASSDPAFRGDSSKHNPEELLLASISSCHMLWYLHLCATAGVIVTGYSDHATGTMEETADGGKFTGITLHPVVTVADGSMIKKAGELHAKANQCCFIANSVNFPVHHEPVCRVEINAN